MRRVAFAAVIGSALVLCGAEGRGSGPTERESTAPPRPIELNDCLIKAVKIARLATDRVGVLAAVEPREGDAVREGRVLAHLFDDVAKANLEVARLVADSDVEVEYAEKLNAVDAIEYAKAVDANRKHPNTVPDIEVRRAQLAQERSRLQIEKAKHDREVNVVKVKEALAELKTYQVIAPFDGVVTRVQRFPGEAVRQGDAILEIVNTDVVQVEGFVNVRDVWGVKAGAAVAVRLIVKEADLPVASKTFQGRIGFVDVISNTATKETRVWAEVANPGNILRPGLKATMTIFPVAASAARTAAPDDSADFREPERPGR